MNLEDAVGDGEEGGTEEGDQGQVVPGVGEEAEEGQAVLRLPGLEPPPGEPHLPLPCPEPGQSPADAAGSADDEGLHELQADTGKTALPGLGQQSPRAQ